MEFGALQCTPGMPNCDGCPLSFGCFARSTGKQKSLPVKAKKNSKKLRYFQYLVYYYNNQLLMKKREGNDIWKGMYQFPLVENAETTVHEPAEIYNISPTVKHILSHQIIEASFVRIELPNQEKLNHFAQITGSEIVSIEESELLPKPVLINNYLKENFF